MTHGVTMSVDVGRHATRVAQMRSNYSVPLVSHTIKRLHNNIFTATLWSIWQEYQLWCRWRQRHATICAVNRKLL